MDFQVAQIFEVPFPAELLSFPGLAVVCAE